MSFDKVQFNHPTGRDVAEPGRRVIVVGGGIAGLAAATALAERGVQPILLEKEAFLGGRAGSWTDRLADGTEFQMERGFHAFFRQYYNLRNLLRRVDPELDLLAPTADYPLFGPQGAMESFADLPRTAPWNLMKLVLRSKSLRLWDLFKINGPQANAMLAYDPVETYARFDETTAQAYLDSLRFPERARRMLFDVFAHSFFNPENRFSAGELIMMFHYYFLGNPEGIVFDVAKRPFGPAFWEPLAARIEGLGGEVRRATAAQRILRDSEGWLVELEGGARVRGDAVVLALTVPALQRIVAASDDLGDATWRQQVRGLSVTAPFAVWRLWLDRPTRAERAPFAGTTGLGIIDNISIYEQLEDESREWVDRTGGSIVELHAYAVPDGMDEAAIKADMTKALYELYPETKDAGIVEERFLLRSDCPAFPPGAHAARPGVETPWPGVTLAGDFVKTPFPTALMERATATGFMAANHLLESWGVRGQVLWSVPPRGMLAKRPKDSAGEPVAEGPSPSRPAAA